MFFFQFYFIVAVHRTVVSGGIYVHLSSPSTTNFIIIKETQCSESEKSRVPNIWFVWKNKDFLVARKQELGYLHGSVFLSLLSQYISEKYLTRNARNNKTSGQQGRFWYGDGELQNREWANSRFCIFRGIILCQLPLIIVSFVKSPKRKAAALWMHLVLCVDRKRRLPPVISSPKKSWYTLRMCFPISKCWRNPLWVSCPISHFFPDGTRDWLVLTPLTNSRSLKYIDVCLNSSNICLWSRSAVLNVQS